MLSSFHPTKKILPNQVIQSSVPKHHFHKAQNRFSIIPSKTKTQQEHSVTERKDRGRERESNAILHFLQLLLQQQSSNLHHLRRRPTSTKSLNEFWVIFITAPAMIKPEKDSIFTPKLVNTIPSNSLNLVSTIIPLSYSIRVFSIKWNSIRAKLDELNTVFSVLDDCGEEVGVLEAVGAAEETLEECLLLAKRCVEVSYSGKLLMQSDLDVVLAKLDGHIKVLSGVVSSVDLMSKQALVVVRPGVGASKDDLRFYVRDLLCRVKIGDVEMKRKGLVSLNEAMVEDERFVKVVVEDDEVVGVLMRFLDSGEGQVVEECVKAATLIAGFEEFRVVLIGSGVIPPVIRVLENGSELGKEMAARCLMKLTANSENGWSVSAQGGVTALLKICSSRESHGGLISLACGVLKNLAEVEEIKRFMIDEGAIGVLVELVVYEDELSQLGSIDLLQALAYKDEPVRQLIIREGGVLALARVLDLKSLFSQKSRELALRAIDKLCFSSIVTLNSLISNGFLDQLLFFLRDGDASVQEMALKSVYRLCWVSEEARKAMGDAGFMPELIRFLNAKSYGVRDMASDALTSMVLVQKNLRHLIQDDQSISLLLQLLDPNEGNSTNRKVLLSTLLAISSTTTGRRKIIRSPYLKNIEQLAEADISDAKKLLRKLSSNRIRSMITGMWHS